MTQAPAQSIRVLVSHSDPLLQAGLGAATAAQADFTVLQLDVQRLASSMQPAHLASVDVIISDYSASMSILAARSSNRHRNQDPAVVVVAMDAREEQVREAVSRGVRGFLTADCTLDELGVAVRCVHRGRLYLCERASGVVAESLANECLSPRERDVLHLLAEGCCNKGIARGLGISVGTVKSHMRGIMSKLHVQSRTQAVVAAERRGLLARLSRSDWSLPASEAA